MTEVARKQRRYTPDEQQTALAVVAFYGGRTELAADKLAEQGNPIPESTLYSWKTHPDGRYAQVCTEIAPRIADHIASQAEAIVVQAGHLEAKLIQQLSDNAHDLKPNEAAGALRNITTTKALNMDKVINPIRGRPPRAQEKGLRIGRHDRALCSPGGA